LAALPVSNGKAIFKHMKILEKRFPLLTVRERKKDVLSEEKLDEMSAVLEPFPL
jgi:hypothetical protein